MSMPSAALGGSAATMQRIGMFAGSRVTKSCPNCKDKSVVIYDNKAGDELCSRCGLILESRVMSDEQEWRSFSNTDGGSGGADRSRVGGPNDAWLQDGVQGTTMLGGDRKHTRLLQTHEMATGLGSSDRQLKTSFSNLRLVTESFALRENVVERCKEIVKDLQSSGNLKTRTGTLYMLSVVYIACREESITRSLKELVTYDRTITEKELGRAINRLKKFLPNRSQPLSYAAAELMPRFCSRLQLSQQVVNVADHVCRKAEQVINRSHRPNSVAAGAIYLVAQLCNAKVDLSDVSAVARTGESTVRTVFKEMLPFTSTLLPPDFRPSLEGGVAALKK
eukprot:Lankesteria_metandrocarpae@DN2264_c0_g1_i2.p1